MTHSVPQHKRTYKRSVSRIISTILLIVGILLLATAGGLYGWQQYNYWNQEQVTQKLKKYVHIPASHTGKKSDAKSEPPTVDWAGLKAINPDVVAWIYIPGTVVNYPIYQGPDNDKYLRHTAEGDWSIGGQLFIDYQNTAPGLVDNHTLVYGHHMNNESMFQPIARISNQSDFEQLHSIWYITEQSATELTPLFIYNTVATDVETRTLNFNSTQALHSFFQQDADHAYAKHSDTDAIIQKASHYLSLITCKSLFGDGRTVLVAVPKSEI
ncbi:class B sortase [Alloscardovia omnicolens]|uniref:class B sortase n=1 Tax=Alloscardovia omnicolens TaxID=419015 RepID=UPI003A64F019